MTEAEFDQTLHGLDFTEDELREILFVGFVGGRIWVDGQPTLGSQWREIAAGALDKAERVATGCYFASGDDIAGIDMVAWAVMLRGIAARINQHFERCVQ